LMLDDGKPIAVIVNPNSASGRTAQAWEGIHAALALAFPRLKILKTEFPGHATALTSQAIRSGCNQIIAVGGDGTLNEVVNGVLPGDDAHEVTLGLIPQGTGSDFRRAVGIPLNQDEAINVIRRGETTSLDAMRVVYRDPSGTQRTRYAVNVTSFGMGGAVAARAGLSAKPFGGTVAFLVATATTALHFKGNQVSLREDDGEWRDLHITNVAVGNGQYHGAGMYVCPDAQVGDGLLDVTIIEKLSVVEIVLNVGLLFNGRIYSHRKIYHSRVRKLAAKSEDTATIEIDGEPLGSLPLEITVLPSALRFIVP
jgi:diacylglycerol kinase (ATP)